MFSDEDRYRRLWQNPEEILKRAGLKAGDIFVDIGCGDGFFAIPAARIVGDSGRVYGVDIDEEAISRLEDKAKRKGLKIVLRVGLAEETIFCERCADMVFFGIVFHDFKDPIKVLSNTEMMLKLGGKLVDVDWRKVQTEIGPPIYRRFSEDEATGRMIKAGFEIESVEKYGLYSYMIIAKSS